MSLDETAAATNLARAEPRAISERTGIHWSVSRKTQMDANYKLLNLPAS